MPALARRRIRLRPVGRWLVPLLLILLAVLLVLLPAWVVVVTSFKSIGEARTLTIDLPREWRIIENYSLVIEDSRMFQGLWNSLVVTIGSVVALLILGAMASWVFARSPSRTVRALHVAALGGILVPPALVPSIAILQALGLYGTHAGLITFYVALLMALTIFIITGFVRTIPTELEDAARIDGCGEVGVFFRIVFPLLQPILLSAALLLTIIVWTEFFSAFLILSGRASHTMPLGLWYVSSGSLNQVRWNYVFTHVLLVSAPLLVFYFVAQRRLLGGVLTGGLKG
jgi:raffinose/stachyose/melibiose transport system permease protein